jgi:acyl-CoA reductase-like NAD-dependent aldehyde dehydrogenase
MVDELRFFAGAARVLEGKSAGEYLANHTSYVRREPIGVCAQITPWNYPMVMAVWKFAPAIAAGNAVVLKPAGQTPISALKLAAILNEAGLPEGWLSVIPGPGSKVGNAIVEHELTKAITFTGSAGVGWDIRSRVPHKKVSLELGSNAPLIVNDDGDWEAAADKAQIHAFSHAGQSCISIQRILLHEDIAEAFTERLVANLGKLTVGDPLDSETDVGPLITRADRDRVKDWIDEAVAAGAELLAGGELVDEGRCLAPTLLGSPPKDTKVWCEEIFGPVATIDTFASFGEALELANDSKFGLQAGVFTRDIGRGLEAGRTLEFGGVLINEVPTFRADQQPYGGVKDSGNTREGPAYAVQELTEERFVTLQG